MNPDGSVNVVGMMDKFGIGSRRGPTGPIDSTKIDRPVTDAIRAATTTKTDYTKWGKFDESDEIDISTSTQEADEAPPIIVALQKAQGLKADGNALFGVDEVARACAKFEGAVDAMADLEANGTDSVCPSTIPEYRDLWNQCMSEKKKLMLSCLLNISLCKIKMKQWDGAVEAASKVVCLDESNAKGFFRRGLARKGRGSDLAEAKRDLVRAAKLQPKDKAIRRELQLVTASLALLPNPQQVVEVEAGSAATDGSVTSAAATSTKAKTKTKTKTKSKSKGSGLLAGLYDDRTSAESLAKQTVDSKRAVTKLCADASAMREAGNFDAAMLTYGQVPFQKILY
jgi:tetratricopeptide (TPR) repeat protein